MDATTTGVDLAKSVFEVAVANSNWRIVARHRFTRPQLLGSRPPGRAIRPTK